MGVTALSDGRPSYCDSDFLSRRKTVSMLRSDGSPSYNSTMLFILYMKLRTTSLERLSTPSCVLKKLNSDELRRLFSLLSLAFSPPLLAALFGPATLLPDDAKDCPFIFATIAEPAIEVFILPFKSVIARQLTAFLGANRG